jgi:hypothetical protein
MKSIKTLAISAAALTGVTALGATALYAATPTVKQDRMNGLVTAIAQKFHLNTTDVQKVFDEQHAQIKMQM